MLLAVGDAIDDICIITFRTERNIVTDPGAYPFGEFYLYGLRESFKPILPSLETSCSLMALSWIIYFAISLNILLTAP